MNTWTDTSTALDALDPIARMSPEEHNRLEYFAAVEDGPAATTGTLRQRLAGGLLKVAIMLDGRAQLALLEARGQR